MRILKLNKMEFNSNLRSFKIYSVVIFCIITIIGLYVKNEFVFLGYIGNLAFWFISIIESNDFFLDKDKIIIRNRLRLGQYIKQVFYTEIKQIKAVNFQYTRHPYQRIELKLNNGKQLKYSCTGLQEYEFKAIILKFENIGVIVIYETD